jgi:hypothetical protein
MVEAFPLTTTGGTVASEVERVCMDNELVITTWSPIHLRTKLKDLYWKGGKTTAGAMAFWEDALRYLYLPRLKTRDSLIQAIRTGAASLDFFGIAYGQYGDHYVGFHFGDGTAQFDDTLLLIEPAAAGAYSAKLKSAEAAERAAFEAASIPGASASSVTRPWTVGGGLPPSISPEATGSGQGSVAGVPGQVMGPVAGSAPKPSSGLVPTAFHGSIQIKLSAAKMHLVQVAEEIINLLASDPNATLNITLEINAEFPRGASDQIRRATLENATSLGFKTKDWE